MTADIIATPGRVPESDRYSIAAVNTYSGMASWAGWGFDGKTCRECRFYGSRNRAGFKYGRGKGPQALKDHSCNKKRELGVVSDPFPHHAMACNGIELWI